MQTDRSLACPNCGKQHRLAMYVYGEYVLRIPVENGEVTPSQELTLNPPSLSYQFIESADERQLSFPFEDDGLEHGELVPTPGVFMRFSDSESQTIITLYKEDLPGRIFCKSCDKVFTLKNVPDYLGENF